MKAIEVIDEVRNALQQLRNKEQENISIDAMDNYMAQLSKRTETSYEIDKLKHDQNLAEFQAENSRNIAHSQNVSAHSVELFKSVITAGQAALKASMVINGGAAAALLAFTGKIWTEGSSVNVTSALSLSILIFCAGLLTAAFATATTYLSQLCYGHHKDKIGHAINAVTIVVVLGSFVCFAYAAYTAASSFGLHFNSL
ncbi:MULTISPECIES: hypothetical protein [Vibrio]|uniref:Uncharacterized protein n=2 Tax=Vibrio TaxID=662 RepID=A0A2N7NKL8_9VIBR|nr:MULTISPECIES: hypothetical protein [Vibrio]OEE56640.1 hypothetical protein A146_02730 [Vibrio splendidus FF-500]PMP15597.1 hypothetical protein BCS92_08780 [Vibrio tasmaniensis]TKG31317.1 hypothetical protein FC057_14320 [Vibrio tasmaniensis]TKG38457.1 hypothetical protein FC063_20835 [Vibrio tasmaniensis]TKG48053.1 hypothetical protein FC060_11090 [Vibrio tasmaniensis]